MLKVKNKTRLRNQLKVLKSGVTKDLNVWIDEALNSARNGNGDFEISKTLTKNGLPELIRFDYSYNEDEDGNIIDEVIEF